MRSSSSFGIRPLRVVATHREATKHPCQGIAFGDSLRSGDMSDREAEWKWESGRLDSLRVA